MKTKELGLILVYTANHIDPCLPFSILQSTMLSYAILGNFRPLKTPRLKKPTGFRAGYGISAIPTIKTRGQV